MKYEMTILYIITKWQIDSGGRCSVNLGIHRHSWLEYEILLLLCDCLYLKNACVNLFYTHFSLVYKVIFVKALILCAKFVCGVFWDMRISD